MNEYEESDYKLKIILFGQHNCWVDSIMNWYCENEFNPNIPTSCWVNYKTKTIIKNNKRIKLIIWTMKGLDIYLPINETYFKGTNGCFAVYDVTDRNSFEKLDFWIDEFEKENKNSIIFIVGNKIDEINRREISEEEAMRYSESRGLKYFECSALTSEGIDLIFSILIEEIINYKK